MIDWFHVQCKWKEWDSVFAGIKSHTDEINTVILMQTILWHTVHFHRIVEKSLLINCKLYLPT